MNEHHAKGAGPGILLRVLTSPCVDGRGERRAGQRNFKPDAPCCEPTRLIHCCLGGHLCGRGGVHGRHPGGPPYHRPHPRCAHRRRGLCGHGTDLVLGRCRHLGRLGLFHHGLAFCHPPFWIECSRAGHDRCRTGCGLRVRTSTRPAIPRRDDHCHRLYLMHDPCQSNGVIVDDPNRLTVSVL